MSYASEVLARSPAAWWRVGESSGTTAADASGNSRAGTYNNTPTLGVAGAILGDSDTAITLSAASIQDVTVPYGSWLDINTAVGFSVAAWVKTSNMSSSGLAVARNSLSANVWHLAATVSTTGKAQAFLRNTAGSTVNSTVVIADNTWHFLVMVWDGGTLYLYVDGALDASTAASASGLATTSNQGLRVGSRGNLFYDGSIDEPVYFPWALSASDVSALYAAGTTVSGTASGTASLSLSASGAAKAAGAGVASLSLTASGAAGATAAGTASLSLDATGDTEPPAAASGTASLSLSASGTSAASATGTAFLALAADGSATGAENASGTATLSLSAFGSATLAAAGTALLELLAVGEAAALFVTDTSNFRNGRTRSGYATVTLDRPVVAPPDTLTFGTKVDKAVAYPVPTMDEGRPT